MRLINAITFEIEEFPDFCVPRYAILSHTWGRDSEELSFRDVEEGNIEKPGIGSLKFRGCCQQAIIDGIDYAWIDTCCIDKTNLVELSEAINSMFRWYQQAAICYAFLSDVPSNENPQEKGSKFRKSRWFQRGWTLQELVAPKVLRFYGTITSSGTCSAQDTVNGNAVQDWHLLGTKGNMSTTIASITGIPREYLLGIAQLHTASVAQRMSWAAHRETKRKEDLAYCLLGIFDITIPMIYGEGGDQAFFRLQEQIMKVIKDDSILAWGITKTQSVNGIQFANSTGKAMAGRVMAKTPLEFANSGHIIRREQSVQYARSVDISGGSVRAHLPLLTTSTGQMFGLLNCGPENNAQQVVGIPLIKLSAGLADEYIRPRGCSLALHSSMLPATLPQPIQIKHDSYGSAPIDSNVLYFHYEDKDFSNIRLKMIDVVPQSSWDEERSLIISTFSSDNIPHQIFIRLRNNKQESEDFVLVLIYRKCNSEYLAECLVSVCSRSLPSKDINLASMMKNISTQKQANNELITLRVALERVKRQPFFIIRPKPILDEIFADINATAELEKKTLIHESLRLLDENEATKKTNLELKGQRTLYDYNIKSLKNEQDDISANIMVLEERQKALMEEEEEYAKKRSIVTSKQLEMAAQIRNTSDQWEDIQKRWNKLQCVDDSITSLGGKTALSWAAAKGLAEVVRQRLEEGADVNTADEDGCTPLIAASEYGHAEVARLLIEKGADLEAKTKEGVTPLFLASAAGCHDLVKLLLDKGANIGVGDAEGMAPLIAASYVGHVGTVFNTLSAGNDKAAMSETEDLNLPSNVSAYIRACVTISKAVEDTDCLPHSIRDLTRLILIQEGLASTSKSLDADSVSGVSRATLKEVFEQCIIRARWLYEIFKDMVPPAEASKTKKFLKKMRTASKATQVDKLIDEMMKVLQIVPENEEIKADKKANTEGPAEDSKKMEQQAQEDYKGGAEDSSNKMSGPAGKYNHNGVGNQNIAMNEANQLNGSIAGETFNFSR